MNLAPSTKAKYKPTSKGWPCPICGNISGFCKSRDGDRGDLLIYCHNETTKPSSSINGYHFTATVGTWGVFSTEKPRNQGPENTRAKNPKRLPQPLPTTADRDAAFRSYMDNLTLHLDDRADLNRRGVSDEQISSWGVISIGGQEPGYMIPCYSPSGSIVGAQWRLRKVVEGARYKWISWLGGGSKNGDELPLTVHRPIGVEPVGIAVCEGIGAKSFILAQYTGMVTIGAGSDSQFISSPDHWRSYLKDLTNELNIANLTLYPDAGAVQNASVMGKYSQWFAFVADLGYTVDVAWWGQSVKGESPDPDELTADVEVKFISVEEFEAIAKPIKEIPWECLPSHLDQVGSWKTQDLGKNSSEMAKVAELFERMKTNPNIKYVGPRTAQPNGSQDAHELHTFSEFEPQLPLDFKIIKIVKSDDGGWLELRVIQRRGNQRVIRDVLIKSISTTKIDKFIDDLKASLGYNVPCTLKPNALQALLQNRSAQYHLAGGRFYKLAPRTGRQDDGYWVFENIQFDPKGNVCTPDESRWLFNPKLGVDEQIASPPIAPQSPNALINLITAAKGYFHAEAFPMALMTLGYGVASIHRAQIVEEHKSIPQINVFGEPGGGKTLAATMACSLFAMHNAAIGSFTQSVLGENLKSLGSLLLLLDDPLKKEKRDGPLVTEVTNTLWRLYDCKPRMVRGNMQTPYSNVIVTSNQAIEGNQAVESRLIKVYFPVRAFSLDGQSAMVAAMDGASGALGQLIGMEYDSAAIEALKLRLTPYLTGAHARLRYNYALLVHYTDRLCKMAGFEFDAFDFCIKKLCPQANQFDSNKDSLTDFLEKLATMRSEGVIGEWNMTQVTNNKHESYLAVQLQSIWPIFASRYQVNYSRQSIEALIIERGGATGENQRFVKSKDGWKEYERALHQFEMGTGRLAPNDDLVKPEKPKKSTVAKSALIPSSIIDKTIGSIDKPIDGAIDSNYSGYSSPAWETIVVPVDEPSVSADVSVEVPPVAYSEIVSGTIATMRIDRPEQGLNIGDEVTISAVQQDMGTGQWFAVIVKNGEDKTPISVWIDELLIRPIVKI